MKFRKLLGGGLLAAVLALGGVAGLATRGESKVAKADGTQTRLYCAIDSSTIGSYSMKLNVKYGTGPSDPWSETPMDMILLSDTYDSKPVYYIDFVDMWNGLATIQFQLYEGSTHRGQDQVMDNVWTTPDVYNGKLWVYGSTGSDRTWKTYTPDVKKYTITQYAVKDNSLDSNPIGSITDIIEGTIISAPKGIYLNDYAFGGWYEDVTCLTPFEGTTITADLPIYGKYTSHDSWSGTINVDLSSSGWGDGAHNFAVYFYDETTYTVKKEAWSNYVTGLAAGTGYIELPYNIGFEPLKMILVSYSSSYTQEQWIADSWGSGKEKQTADADFSNKVTVIKSNEGNDWLKSNVYAEVFGGTELIPWSKLFTLNSVKKNGSNHTEYFGEVTLPEGYDFKIVYDNNSYYGNYTCHESLADDFDGGSGSNIHAKKGGTYEFYFDSALSNVYITTAALAEADEWAQTFLAGVTCDGDGSITKDQWSTLSGTYAALSDDAKDIFEAIPTHGDEDGTYAEAAVARYDYILIKYGIGASAPKHTDFMGRFAEGGINQNVPTAQAPISIFGSMDNSTPIMLVVIISVVSLTAVGGYIFLKRRKED